MGEKINLNEHLNKKDLELILEVNKQAIEIESEVAEQNEEMISLLNKGKDIQESIEDKVDKLSDKTEKISRDIFKLQVLYIGAILGLITQIIQIFLKN